MARRVHAHMLSIYIGLCPVHCLYVENFLQYLKYHGKCSYRTQKFKPKAKNHTSETRSSNHRETSNGCTKTSKSETSRLEANGNIISLSVLPMLLFHKSSPEKILKVYGMLDYCSEGSSIDPV